MCYLFVGVGISYTTELYTPNLLPPYFTAEFKNSHIIVCMTPAELLNLWLTIIISAATIISVTAMGVRWLVKHYFEEIKKELKPNSGSSLKDQVNRLEARQDKADTLRKETYLRVEKLENKIDDLYEKFIDYLSKNNK